MNKDINVKKAFLAALVASLCLGALVGIVVLLFGNWGELEAKILLTTLTIGGFSLTGLCSSALLEKKTAASFALSGISVSLIGFLFTTLSIWELITFPSLWKLLTCLITISFSMAHSSLLLLPHPKNQITKIISYITISFIWIVALMFVFLLLEIIRRPPDLYFRLMGVFAVLDVLGTITTPILTKLLNSEP